VIRNGSSTIHVKNKKIQRVTLGKSSLWPGFNIRQFKVGSKIYNNLLIVFFLAVKTPLLVSNKTKKSTTIKHVFLYTYLYQYDPIPHNYDKCVTICHHVCFPMHFHSFYIKFRCDYTTGSVIPVEESVLVWWCTSALGTHLYDSYMLGYNFRSYSML